MNKILLKSSLLLIAYLTLSQGNVLASTCGENGNQNQHSCTPKVNMSSSAYRCKSNPNSPGFVNCKPESKITSNNVSCNGNKYSCGGNKK
jgi:hypothetical protein